MIDTTSTLADYEKDLCAIESSVTQARAKLAKFHALNREMAIVQEEALDLETSTKKEINAIKKDLKVLNDASITSKLLERCETIETEMEDVRRIRPLTGSLFLRFFLGRVNVRVFNDRYVILFIVFLFYRMKQTSELTNSIFFFVFFLHLSINTILQHTVIATNYVLNTTNLKIVQQLYTYCSR